MYLHTNKNFSLLDLRYVRQCTFRNVVFVSYHFFLIFFTCRNSCQFFSLVPLIITTSCKSLSSARKVEFSKRSRDILLNQEDSGLRKFSSSIFSFFIYEKRESLWVYVYGRWEILWTKNCKPFVACGLISYCLQRYSCSIKITRAHCKFVWFAYCPWNWNWL